MDLEPFNAKQVSPGEPVTAQAWNEIVTALDNTHRFLMTGKLTVRVQITTPNLDLRTVRVTAERADQPRIEGVRPVLPGGEHVLTGLTTGPYTIRADAFGFEVGTHALEVQTTDPPKIELLLAPLATPVMPNLFGLALTEARSKLGAQQIPIRLMVDFAGQQLTAADAASDYADSPVLAQSPTAGQLVPQDGVALGIAIATRPETAIEVPNLTGLTEAEARKALERLGLTVATVTKRAGRDA